jgi:hypothetical protein
MDPGRVQRWCSGICLPQLLSVLHICYQTGTTLVEFLTDENFDNDIHLRTELPYTSYKIKRIKKPLDEEALRAALEAILSNDELPPPSMVIVAEQLKIECRRLRYRFPELYRRISARFKEYRRECKLKNINCICEEVKRVVLELHATGLKPTKRRVRDQMSKCGYLRNKVVARTLTNLRQELGY